MQKNRKTLFVALGLFQLLFILVMAVWMLFDAYRAISSAVQEVAGPFLLEPIVWHKVGEILLIFPVGIALAAFFPFWKPNVRRKYLQIIAPLMFTGGIMNMFASWGFYQKPRTEFNDFMVYFGVILLLAGFSLPFLLKWIHKKRLQKENETVSSP